MTNHTEETNIISALPSNHQSPCLEELLKNITLSQERIYILSEVGYDTRYFNSDAYQNFLTFMKNDPSVTGLIVDGAITRLDRPEYLNESLSYWEKDESFCQEESRRIPNNQQYNHMFEAQLYLLQQKFQELRTALPTAKIIFNSDTDDFQFTLSAIINEAMLRKVQEIDNTIDHLKSKRTEYREELSNIRKEQKKDTKEHRGSSSSISPSSSPVSHSSSVPHSSSPSSNEIPPTIENMEHRLKNIDEEISEQYTKKNLWREKKVRPAHQVYTRQLLESVYSKLQVICDQENIELVTKPSILSFGSFFVHYSHCGSKTWSITQAPDENYISHSLELLRRAKRQGVDIVVESGHHGKGYKQLQKLYDSVEETNFQNQSSTSPKIGQEHLTVLFALPFEDQTKIGEFVSGLEPIRLSGGKPLGTRKIAAIDRLASGGSSGLTIIDKDHAGLIGTEWIPYAHFISSTSNPSTSNSSTLNPSNSDSLVTSTAEVLSSHVSERSLICATSDEHIGSPEENILVRKAASLVHTYLSTNPLYLHGKTHLAAGFISGGDTAEANTRKWNHRYHFRKDPIELLYENIEHLQRIDTTNPQSILLALHQLTSDQKGGSVEDMQVILRRVADYYESYLNTSIKHSSLQFLHLSVPGNHADGVLADLGLRESDFFLERLKSKSIPIFEVGKESNLGTARIAVGGYSLARILQIPQYGLSTDGTPLFGPVNLLIQHDPKGSKSSGLVGAGRSVNADLALAGHTHETYIKTYTTTLNNFGIAYRLATLQGTTPTEKYYAASPPRTQASHIFIIKGQGHLYEKTIPAPYLEKIARAHLQETIEHRLH